MLPSYDLSFLLTNALFYMALNVLSFDVSFSLINVLIMFTTAHDLITDEISINSLFAGGMLYDQYHKKILGP